MKLPTSPFDEFTEPLLDQSVSHIWCGHGSAVFLEIGELRTACGGKQNGFSEEPHGQFGIMIEWSWRIEGRKKIVCGSWSDERLWQRGFRLLLGKPIDRIESFGRLQEISITVSSDARLVSFMTADGDPSWAIFDRTGGKTSTLYARNGQIRLDQ